ncbi:MAG: YfhO family protein [Candidatus Hodarchaeota archaeon]
MLKDHIISMSQWFKKSVQVWKSDLIYVTILLLSACIFFWPVLLHPDQMFDFFDMVYVNYPWGFFTESMLKKGQFPLWLPYCYSGEPFIANIQTAVFYPPHLILLMIFPTHLALGFSILLHIFLAGLFMYILMRYLNLDNASSFLSSIIFMYSGFFIAHALRGHYTMILAACWLPLIFLLFNIALKKTSVYYGLLTGIPISLQFLAGHPQMSLYTLFALGLYLVFRSLLIIKEKRALKEVAYIFAISALAIVVGVLLAAIQLIPTFEFLGLTTRGGGVSYDFATTYSFPRQNLITFLLPNFYGNFVSGWGLWHYTEVCVYVGILPLIFIFFAIFFKRSEKEEREFMWFFTGLAVFSMLLAFGRYTQIYWLAWKYIPGINIFRAPSRFRFLVTFSAAILAGFGFSFFKGNLTLYERKNIGTVIKILALLIIWMISEIFLFGEGIVQGNLNRRNLNFLVSIMTDPTSIQNRSFPIILDWLILTVLSIGCVVLLALRIINKTFKFQYFNKCFNILKKNINVIVILFVLANLWFFHIGFVTTTLPNDVYSEPDYVEFLKNNSGIYRVYDEPKFHHTISYRSLIPDNSQIIYGIHELSSFNPPMQLQTYTEVLDSIHPLSDNTHHPILNLLNVKYILSSNPLNNSGFELAFSQNHIYIYENKQVLPKAFVLHKVKILSEDDIIKELRSTSFNPIDAILLEQQHTIETLNEGYKGVEHAEIRTYSPNEIIVAVNIIHPGYLVLSENYYPGWKVYVDGEQREIYRAYHTLRAVYLDAGSHKLRFTYESASLKIGLWITFLTSLFLVGTISMKCFLHLKIEKFSAEEAFSKPKSKKK